MNVYRIKVTTNVYKQSKCESLNTYILLSISMYILPHVLVNCDHNILNIVVLLLLTSVDIKPPTHIVYICRPVGYGYGQSLRLHPSDKTN